jgi:hypothetical protein
LSGWLYGHASGHYHSSGYLIPCLPLTYNKWL